MSGQQVIPDWKEGDTERRIPNVVAQYAVRENARLAEQVRMLREAIIGLLSISQSVTAGQEQERMMLWMPNARAALAATAPRDDAQEGK